MNVFVLSTGRSGSSTFAAGCRCMRNYTTGHETHAERPVPERYAALVYPPNHIEIDNRLAWHLGKLDEVYGEDAFYVHLIRDADQVAESHRRRWQRRRGSNIIFTYAWGVCMYGYIQSRRMSKSQKLEMGRQYWETVNANIRLFLKDKPQQMTIHLEHLQRDFPRFWRRIRATGELGEAQALLGVHHNRMFAGQNGKSEIPKKKSKEGLTYKPIAVQ